MGSAFNFDNRISNLIDFTETYTCELIEALKQNYNSKKLKLGAIRSEEFYGNEVIFTIVESEFENVILHFKKKNVEFGSAYEILVEMRYLDSPTELKISIDESHISNLPEEMLADLDKEMDKILFKSDD